jgi:hypothetical protein
VGVQRHALSFYRRERLGTDCTGGWVGPTAGLEQVRKTSRPIGIQSPDHPASSKALYRLSYPGPQTLCNFIMCNGPTNALVCNKTLIQM